MAFADDFDVIPYSLALRHIAGQLTVWQVQAYYSALMDLFEEPGFGNYPIPMRFLTPTSYEMRNGWYLDNGDGSEILKYLTGATIASSGYANDVLVQDYDTISTDFDSADLDQTVTGGTSGAIGPLLSFITDYPAAGQGRCWIRDVNGVGPTTNGEALTTPTGASVLADGASFTGEDVYANLFTLADFPGSPNPQVYIVQQHPKSGSYVRIDEWSNLSNWDRGSIDVLVPVKIGGVAIDSGSGFLFVRQPGDSFTLTSWSVSTTEGSRTPISTETSADVNVTKGEWYLFYSGSTGDPGINTGDVVQDVATGSTTPPSWYAEVVSSTYWGSNTGYLVLRGLRGTPADTDDIYVGASDTTANVNGSAGDTYAVYDAESTGPVAGDLDKVFEGSLSGAQRLLKAYQDDGTAGKLLFAVQHAHATVDTVDFTGANRNTLYRDFVDNDVISASGGGSMGVTLAGGSTTLISGYSDIDIIHINGTCTHSGTTGAFTPGERVTWNGGTSSAYIVYDSGSVITLGNVDPTDEPVSSDVILGDLSTATCTLTGGLTDDNTEGFNFLLKSTNQYSVFIGGGDIYEAGRSLQDFYMYLQYARSDGHTEPVYTSDGSSITVVEAQAYIKADPAYATNKQAPYGTLAGVSFFGAQGVWVQDVLSSDINNLKLTDDTGTPQSPDPSIDIIVTNTRALDVIWVHPYDTGTGDVQKDQYTSHATLNAQGDSTLDEVAAGGGFPNDTPLSGGGTVFVVAADEQEEHRYRYDSWNNTGGGGSDGQLVLSTGVSGTADSTVDDYTLTDTGVFASNVQRGDIIRRTNGSGGWAYIVSVDSANQVTTTKLSAGGGWTSGDTFETNKLVQTYDAGDTFWITYMDTIEDTGTEGSPGTETVSVLFVTTRNVLIRARTYSGSQKIVDFELPLQITSTGMSQAIIRNPDTVAT